MNDYNRAAQATADSSMHLSQREIGWAQAVKAAVKNANQERRAEGEDELMELSDFEYCQYGLVARGDVESALDRIEKMQAFREEYQINDTVEEGMEVLEAFTQQQPWFMVSVDYNPTHGHFIAVYDYARLKPSAVDYPEDWRIWLGGLYYIYQLCQSNLASCREGLVHIAECQGMWYSNFNMDFMYRNWHHLIGNYPLINKECSWLHTPLVGNIQHAFYKSMMGDTADIIRVGCHFDGYDGRIDEMFKTPSEDIAEFRLLARYSMYLKIRYLHQSKFRLPSIDPPDTVPPPVTVADADDGVNQRNEQDDNDDDDDL